MSDTNGRQRYGTFGRAITSPAATASSLVVIGGISVGWIYDLRVDLDEDIADLRARVEAQEERISSVNTLSAMRHEQQEEDSDEALRILRDIRAEQRNIRAAQDLIRRKLEDLDRGVTEHDHGR